MIVTILSNFNNRIGPQIFLKFPDIMPSMYLDRIPLLMDLHKNGFFIHEFSKIKSANLIFDVYSPLARGRKEILMLSLVSINEEYSLSLSSFQEIMLFFVNEFRKIKDIYRGFYYEQIPEAKKEFIEITDFLHSFSQSLPNERAIFKQNISKILTYGLSQSGKINIIKNLQAKFSQSKQTIGVDISLEDFKFP